MAKAAKNSGMYQQIIAAVFNKRFVSGSKEAAFTRDDIIEAADKLGLPRPGNVGDVLYSFRHRGELPDAIRKLAPKNKEWIIRAAGTSKYKFALVSKSHIVPNAMLVESKIPDSTPGIIAAYAMTDEQALLAKLRYNRLIDIFTGVTCYSLQNHLRTQIKDVGQIETDELYVGIDKRGAHYVFPVQGKGGTDKMGIVQIEQDVALCREKFPALICRPIAAQFMQDDKIAMFEFELGRDSVKIASEKHYRLVSPDQMTEKDLQDYRMRKLD